MVGKRSFADRVQKAVEKWRDEFEDKFSVILKSYKPSKAKQRSVEDMVGEVLELVRSMSITQSKLTSLESGSGKTLTTSFLNEFLKRREEEKSSLGSSLLDLLSSKEMKPQVKTKEGGKEPDVSYIPLPE